MVKITDKKYYTIKELADILQVSRITVFKKVQSGQIKAEKAGRTYIIAEAEAAKILGGEMTEKSRAEISKGVSRVIKEYGETLRLLGGEYNRSIQIINNKIGNLIDVPVVGSAGCDNLEIFADQNYNEFIKVDKNIVRNKKVFAIKAQGLSMEEAGILSGDYVITEIIDKPDDKDIVVAIVDGMAVIKRIGYLKNKIVLNPEPVDGLYKPIIIKEENLKICGRVLDIIKDPKNEEIQYIDIDQ